MKRRTLALGQVYKLLEPGPVVLLATARGGRANVMTLSWHTMLEFEPPLVGCVVSNRNGTFEVLRSTKQCVIAIPTVELVKQVVGCGNTSGCRIDKFETFALTPAPAALVAAPLIDECYANLECRVVDARMVNKYNFFVLEVVKAWVRPGSSQPRTIHHRGRGLFMVAGRTLKLPSRMK